MRTSAQKDMEPGARIVFALKTVEIGRDGDSDPVTSCVLVDAEPPEETPALGKNQRAAFEAVAQWVSDHGTPNRGGMGWPEASSRRILETEDFVSFLTGKMTNQNPKDRPKAARQAVDGLVAKKLVQKNEGKIWPI